MHTSACFKIVNKCKISKFARFKFKNFSRIFEYFQAPYLFSSTFKGLEVFIPNSSIFRDISSTLWTLYAARVVFGGTSLCSCHARGVHGSWAKHFTIEFYTAVMLLPFVLIIISIPSHLTLSFIPGLKLSFSANPSHFSLPFLLQDWLHGFHGLFTDTSSAVD